MTRNLKALGLALVALFAMSALAATAAQATEQTLFTSDTYSASIDATTSQAIGEEKEYFESIGRRFECEVAHFSGTLAAASADLTITPDYTDHTQGGNCRAAGLVVTVTENNCKYTFTGTTNGTNPDGSFKIGVDISFPIPGPTLTVHIRNLLNTADACTITVEHGTVTHDLKGVNNGNHVDISGTVTPHVIIHSNNTAICGVEAGTSKTETAKYVVNTPITVTAPGKDLTLSH